MLETDRLILRQWSDNDLAPFSEINRNKEVMEHFPSILTHKETVKFYKRIVSEFSEFGIGLYALELKSDGKFIGYTGFHHFDFDAEFSPGIEIGWRLDSRYWNHGYATEAAKAWLEYAGERQLFKHIYSFTATCNLRSERVMQKTGMTRAGSFMHPALPDGHPLKEHVLYRKDL